MSDVYIIDGPPGTGKTRYLTEQCARAVEAHGPESVAIASLTRTAAAEIAGRVALPDNAVGTMHAHAYRGLDRPKLAETPEGLHDWNDHNPAEALTTGGPQNVLEDAPTEDPGQEPGDRLHAAVMNHRARITPREQWSVEERAHDDRWQDFKAQTGREDFTDLIERATEELQIHPAMPEVLLLDEAQDFSALEMRLALTWAANAQTAVIAADTRQSLYTWRGASPEMLDAMQVTGRRTLSQSYRVPHAVHALAQQWVGQLPSGAANYQPTPEPGIVDTLPATLKRPDELIDSLRQDIADGRDSMVLASCGYMLGGVIHALREAGLPFHNPYRVKAGNWNPMRSAHRLASYLRWDPDVWGDEARGWSWADLRAWTEPLKSQGVMARGAKALIESKCEGRRVGPFESNSADEIVDPRTVADLLGSNDLEHPAFSGDVQWWRSNLLASKAKSLSYPCAVFEASGGEALVKRPTITIGTGHSVKGGEAAHVYMFPDLSRAGYWNGWMPRGPERDAIVRLFYVMMTRASEHVTLLDASASENIRHDLAEALALSR